MILCTWNGEWVLCGRGPANGVGCGMGVRPSLASWAQSHGMTRAGTGAFWSKAVSHTGGIRFFTELRFRGNKVYPQAWHPTAGEPLVKVFAPSISGRDYFFANPPTTAEDFYRALRADGWDWSEREGGTRYCHVDELEKIEGPPPEGPF